MRKNTPAGTGNDPVKKLENSRADFEKAITEADAAYIASSAIPYVSCLIRFADGSGVNHSAKGVEKAGLSEQFTRVGQALDIITSYEGGDFVATPEHFKALGRLEQRRGNDQKAFDVLSVGIDRFSDDAPLHVRRIWSAIHLKRDLSELVQEGLREAESGFSREIVRQGKRAFDPLYKQNDARSKKVRRGFAQALGHILEASDDAQHGVRNLAIKYTLAEAQRAKPDEANMLYERAHDMFCDVMEVTQQSAAVYRTLAEYLTEQGRMDDCRDVVEEGLSFYEANPELMALMPKHTDGGRVVGTLTLPKRDQT